MSTLDGYVILELAGMGPGPMAGMLLADMGATVIRVERSQNRQPGAEKDISLRGKKSIIIDLKSPEGHNALMRLIEKADCLIDPFRPGVCEKLGIGPDTCMARNPKLVFARITGWGQDGPLAQTAGHDINYIAITGALHAIGHKDQEPVPPLNIIGDMGGGGMLLVQGILAAFLERHNSGKGQIIDAAMVDGTAQLMWMSHSAQNSGQWNDQQRESNALDGGAPFYATYECKDGNYMALGAIEPHFFAEFLRLANIDPDDFGNQFDPTRWPELKDELTAVFRQKTRAQWSEIFEGSDACISPVLTMTEAATHKANTARNVYVTTNGQIQPAPAPRFSRTPSTIQHGPRACGADTDDILRSMGFETNEIKSLRQKGAVA